MTSLASSAPSTPLTFDDRLAASLRADQLQLILLPTEHCNFRCTYCYEDFAIGRMNPDVVGGVKKLIDRRANTLTALQLSWFGGEPLLAEPIIEEISAHAIRVQQRSGLQYTADMTTNGYLLNAACAERLATLGVRKFQISLDGHAEDHDRTRIRADGNGTFERIWRNLLEIGQSSVNVQIMLRIHVTPQNISTLPTFLTLVKQNFLSDERFTVFLKRIVRLGGANDDSMSVLDVDDERFAALEALVLDGSRQDQLFEPDEVCYAARANSLLVRADGRIGKCTVALSNPANTIGRLRADGTLEVDNSRFRRWLEGWESRDEELTSCPYLGFTRGQTQLVKLGKRPLAGNPAPAFGDPA